MQATEAAEQTKFRTLVQKSYFDMQKHLKAYLKNKKEPNKKLINFYIESQIKMMSLFAPFAAEEAWHFIGKKSFVSLEKWPVADESKIDMELEYMEGVIENTKDDIKYVKGLIKIENPKKIVIIVAQNWKYELYKRILSEKTNNPNELIGKIMKTDLKKYGKEIAKIIPKIIGRLPERIVEKDYELKVFSEGKSRIEKEFNCKISVEDADKFKHEKSSFALPGKPAIFIE